MNYRTRVLPTAVVHRSGFASAALLLAVVLPLSAQLGYSPGGWEGLQVRLRVLGQPWSDIGSNGGDNATAGTKKDGPPIDGISMRYYRAKLEYQVRVEGAGWLEWTKSGEETGTAGKRIEGLRVRANRGSVRYRVYWSGGGVTEWLRDGEAAEQPGGRGIAAVDMEYRAIAREGQTFEFRVAFKGKGFTDWLKPGATASIAASDPQVTAFEFRNGGGIRCEVLLKGLGWRPTVAEGKTAGDPKGRYIVECFRILSDSVPLKYRALIDGQWSLWYHDGDICGLVGFTPAIQAVQIETDTDENPMANR